MKVAAYNLENLFDRAKAFNDDSAEARLAVQHEARLNLLFEKELYTPEDKEQMLELLSSLGILKVDEGKYVWLRKIRGSLLKRPRAGAVQVVAEGRGDWVGWVELKTAHVNEISVLNTGQVIRDVNADVLAVVEAENRVALKQFSEYVLGKVNAPPYDQIMLIDGNDDRGIDVGLMTKNGYTIGTIKSHVHDLYEGKPIFSRDCPEYCVETRSGEEVYILPNHFKSKFGGNNADAQTKRQAQATRVAEIYNRLRKEGKKNVIILGDLNDTPDSVPLAPLLSATDLKEISEHSSFDTGTYKGKGTYGLGGDDKKIDYLLLSPALFKKVKSSGLFRKGAWPGTRPKRWEVYPEMVKEMHAASDHHLIWCDIDI